VNVSTLDPVTVDSFEKVGDALRAGRARSDWRDEVRRVEWILSFGQTEANVTAIMSIVKALGYIGIVNVWLCEATTKEAKVFFRGGRLYLDAPRNEGARRAIKEIPGWSWSPEEKLWSVPADEADAFFVAVASYYPNNEGLEKAMDEARAHVAARERVASSLEIAREEAAREEAAREAAAREEAAREEAAREEAAREEAAREEAAREEAAREAAAREEAAREAAAREEAAREEAAREAAAREEAAARKPRASLEDFGTYLIAKIPYIPELVADIKALPYADRRYNPDRKEWEISGRQRERIRAMMDKYFLILPEARGTHTTLATRGATSRVAVEA
jgi:hypothetical protein